MLTISLIELGKTAMNILTAVVTQVPIGNTSVEGLMTEDGTFYVGVPQIATQFSFIIANASRDVKALLGKDSSFIKLRTPLNSKAVNAIPLAEFEQLVAKLDRKGNKAAQDFRDSLVGLSLHQLFCDAFGIKLEKEDRQQYLAQRMQHRQHFHPYLTKWLKQDANGDSNAVDWGREVNRFKTACKLPLTGVDTWDYNLLQILNRAESGYNMLRIAGLKHDEAVAVIRSQH